MSKKIVLIIIGIIIIIGLTVFFIVSGKKDLKEYSLENITGTNFDEVAYFSKNDDYKYDINNYYELIKDPKFLTYIEMDILDFKDMKFRRTNKSLYADTAVITYRFYDKDEKELFAIKCLESHLYDIHIGPIINPSWERYETF